MHIVILILTIIGGIGFWYYRMRAAKDVAVDAIDAAQRVRGHYKRAKFRAKADESVFAAIDDPLVGASTMAATVIKSEGCFDDVVETKLFELLKPFARDDEHLNEAVIYGSWAADQKTLPDQAIKMISPLLVDTLNPSEREEVIQFIASAMGASQIEEDVASRYFEKIQAALQV